MGVKLGDMWVGGLGVWGVEERTRAHTLSRVRFVLPALVAAPLCDQRAIVGHIEEARVMDRLAQLADPLVLSWLCPAPIPRGQLFDPASYPRG